MIINLRPKFLKVIFVQVATDLIVTGELGLPIFLYLYKLIP